MTGICGTCGYKAEASEENQGYSSCCNDRIAYGVEAAEVVADAIRVGRENVSLFEKTDPENAAWHQRQVDRLVAIQKEGS